MARKRPVHLPFPRNLMAVLGMAAISASLGAKLNVPRVLLPYSTEGCSFVIHSDDATGCFRWRSSRPEFVVVTPIAEDAVKGCSSSAIVSPSSKTWFKGQSVITAEDVDSTGHFLRCDVIVDVIHSLQIVTRTHELFLEEAPEEFQVRAYDSQGNEFTSVENMIFKWNIENLVRKGHGTQQTENIRFVNFKDSSYALDETLQKIEESGRQGWKVLLDGVKTGSSKISVRIATDSATSVYAKVPPVEVNVMVVANLYLVPDSAFILTGGLVRYRAEQIKSNKVHKITFPSQQYLLRVNNSDIAELHASAKDAVRGVGLGGTEVMLHDTNLSPEDEIRPPQANLYVVLPNHIKLTVYPHKNWHVIVGEPCDIVLDVFDGENNRIFPSENLISRIEVAEDFFKIREQTQNGTRIFGIPLKVGTVDVKGILIGVRDDNGVTHEIRPQLLKTDQLEIFDRIVLQPKVAAFPWDPEGRAEINFQFNIDGRGASSGTAFSWNSSNSSIATVNQNGKSRAFTATCGQTRVKASMRKASHNYGESDVFVVPAAGLIILDHFRETAVGTELKLPLHMHGLVPDSRERINFTECHQLPISVVVGDDDVFAKDGIDEQQKWMQPGDLDDKHEQPCASLTMRALKEGFTEVTVRYALQTKTMIEKGIALSNSTFVAAFSPLQPLQPKNGEALLCPDSSLHIVWTGGPLPWDHNLENHFHVIEKSVESVVKIGKRISAKGGANTFVFEVTCLKMGEVDLTLHVGNKNLPKLPHPRVVSSKVRVVCDWPKELELTPVIDLPVDTTEPCPASGRASALAPGDVKIQVSAFDAQRRKFLNISTLDLAWRVSDEQYGKLKQKKGVEYSNRVHEDLGFKIADGAFQTFFADEKPGQVDITATMTSSNSFMALGAIEENLALSLVQEARIERTDVSVFNHPDNLEHIKVLGGSGFFQVRNGLSKVAESIYMHNTRTISIQPKMDGDVALTIKDLCLKTKKPLVVRIHVTGIHTVDLVMNDKVQKGKLLNAHIKLRDRHGRMLTPSAYKFIKLSVESPGTGIVKIQRNDTASSVTDYIVRGLSVGDTSVKASVTFGAQTITSIPAPLHVFPPLELEPRNITLIIGSKFQVRAIGGPEIDCSLDFKLDSTRVAEVNTLGLIEGVNLGSTRLTARAIGTEKLSGNKVLYSQDHVNVHVVKLSGIRIRTPLQRVRVGGQLPLLGMGLDEHQNAFSFGSALPHLELRWSLSNQHSADLQGVFHSNGLGISKVNNGAMRLLAKKPGSVIVRLYAKISAHLSGDRLQLDRNQEFSHQVEIQIIDELQLVSPSMSQNMLLMSPNSQMQLRTNREAAGNIAYTVLSDLQSPNELITVSKSGLIKTGSSTGWTTVLVEDSEDNSSLQHLSIVVCIKRVSYMMINVGQAFVPNPERSTLKHLPKGISLPVDITYHDSTGLRFDATNLQARYRLSRFDSVLITSDEKNNSARLDLSREELTVLRASVGGGDRTDLQDFIVLDIRNGIAPTIDKAVLLGDHLHLHSLILNPLGQYQGKWYAEPQGVVHIDQDTGRAVTTRTGQARVSYFIADGQRTSIDIEIKPPAKIVLHSDDTFTRSREVKFIPFSVRPEGGSETTNFIGSSDLASNNNLVTTEALLFECRGRFTSGSNVLESYFRIRSVFNFEMKSYACELEPKPSLFEPGAATLADTLEIIVAPLSAARHFVREERATLRFLSGFHVPVKQLELSNDKPADALSVHGVDDILFATTAKSSNSELLTIGRDYRDDAGNKVIPVYLTNEIWKARGDHLFVTVSCSLTGETVDVPVSVTFTGGTYPVADLNWTSLFYFLLSHYQSILAIVIVSLSCIFLTICGVQNTMLRRANQMIKVGPSAAFAQPGASSTPQSHTNVENRPRLWTVDDSPVYGSPSYTKRSPRSLTQYSYSDR